MNPNEIDVSKTHDIQSISHGNDMDREFNETYFQETMSLRRRTMRMTRSHTQTMESLLIEYEGRGQEEMMSGLLVIGE